MVPPRIALRTILVILPVLSLVPVGLITADWVQLTDLIQPAPEWRHHRAFDWVHWSEVDGTVEAVFVYPEGPGDRAGVREGDVLFELADHQLYSAQDFKDIIEGLPPGSETLYTVQRSDGLYSLEVELGRYPTFLYPLSSALWYTSVWGFMVGGFLHVLALLIVLPLTFRSPSALRSALLILASSLWVMGNLGRMLWILMLGPADALSHDSLIGFQILTLLSLAGWIIFPKLLVLHVLADLPEPSRPSRLLRALLWIPPVLLGLIAVVSAVRGHVGPLNLDNLVAPILFYVSCYVAAASGISLYASRSGDASLISRSGWSRFGTTLVFLLSAAAALLVLGLLPLTDDAPDTAVGWAIVSAQLLSVLPVGLESFATLQYGKVNEVLSRALSYILAVGFVFFTTVGGLFLVEPLIDRLTLPRPLTIGAFLVVLLLAFDQLGRWTRPLLKKLLTTDRQRSQQRLIRFFDRMRSLLDAQVLGQRTVDRIGAAMDARWARLYLRAEGSDSWLVANYTDSMSSLPRITRSRVWTGFEHNGDLWSRNPELNDAWLPAAATDELLRAGAALAIPVAGEERPVGMLILGPRRGRREVYNITDVDLLRATCNQLALALVRIRLVEREKELVRESAEAELAALRAQINPHFLFNTLNTIAALIEEKPDQAEETVEHLAAIFRHILQIGGKPFVRLQTEIEQIRRYLAIEQARFGDRLTVEVDIPSDTDGWLVPAFAIQTLVENAVLHGIARTVEGGRVRIVARRAAEDEIEVRVEDTGPGIPGLELARDESNGEMPAFFGLGLRNVAGRLEKLYDRTDLLSFACPPGGGTTARMLLPHSEARTAVRSATDHVPSALESDASTLTAPPNRIHAERIDR